MDARPVSGEGPLVVTVLGCDGSYPGPAGACSGYLVSGGGVRVWLDAGSGTLAALQTHIDLADVDAVVISHAHPDHWSDLDGFAVACRGVLGRGGVPVHAPEGVQDLARVGGDDGSLDWRVIADGDRVTIGEQHWRFCRTDHPGVTLAARVDLAGRHLGYSADTGPAWDLASLGPGVHLALCEASFLSDKEGSVQHLSARQAGRTARAAGVERLVITHLQPPVDRDAARMEAQASFGAAVTVAAAGLQWLV
ncbi:MAG: MBL fold metallo-hydrolase [Acidimicrobiales bacterium]